MDITSTLNKLNKPAKTKTIEMTDCKLFNNTFLITPETFTTN